jgi:hypothetical protein
VALDARHLGWAIEALEKAGMRAPASRLKAIVARNASGPCEAAVP